MNNISKWYLKRVFAREVRQGFDHDHRIQQLYRLIVQAARNEFCEDDRLTFNNFMRCLHEDVLSPKEETLSEKGE